MILRLWGITLNLSDKTKYFEIELNPQLYFSDNVIEKTRKVNVDL